MSKPSKYGSTWPNKWLRQMLSSCRSMHSSTPALAKTRILRFYQPHMGKQKPFKGIIESHLGIIESLWGIIEPLLGITKPTEGKNSTVASIGFKYISEKIVTKFKHKKKQ